MFRRWNQPGSIAITLLVASLVVTVAPAQDAVVRRPTFALVLDVGGKPMPGAVVAFAGSLPHLGFETGFRDVQLVASDARGRARASLDPRLCYVAWALGPQDSAGAQQLSPVHGYFSAGALFELHCDAASAPTVLEVRGAEKWAHRGPLRYVLLSRVPCPEIELETDAQGRLVVPPCPEPHIEVRLADGKPLLHAVLGDGVLLLPPPQRVRVKVVDAAGKPMVAVGIVQRVARLPAWAPDGIGGVGEDRLRTLGVTDAEGRAAVEVPYDEDPMHSPDHGDLLLLAHATGRPQVMGGIKNRAYYENDRKVAAVADGEFHFTIPAVEPLVGCCASAPAGSVAHLTGVCKLFLDRASYSHDPRAFTAPIGPDGRFAFDELPMELHSCRLAIVPPESSSQPMLIFCAQSERSLPRAVMPSTTPVAAPAFLDVEVAVIDPSGGPALGVVASLVPGDLRGILMRDSVARLPLDGRGSARLRLEPGKWIIVVQSDVGWAAQAVDFDRPGASVKLTMQELAMMRVELQDNDGKPIPNASLQLRGSSTRGSSDSLQTVLQSLRTMTRAQWSELRTDERGRMTIPFVPVDGMTQRLALKWQGGLSRDFELVASPALTYIGAR